MVWPRRFITAVLGGMFLLGILWFHPTEALATPKANASQEDAGTLLNPRYAQPFGFRPDVLLENHARFGYFFNGGEIYGRNADEHGGYGSVLFGIKNFIGLELASKWTSGMQSMVEQRVPCEASEPNTCLTRVKSNWRSRAELGFTPKYRLPIDLAWFWMNLSAEIRVPVNTGGNREARMVEVNPGFQMYFDAADWFGFELDGQALIFLTDPEEDAPRKTVPGAFMRGNFLFKINPHHFIGLQVEETLWFPGLNAQDEADGKAYLSFSKTPVRDGLTETQRIAMLFPATNNLSAGGGYQVRYGVFNGGIGALYHITDTDSRHTMSLFVDLRFAFE